MLEFAPSAISQQQSDLTEKKFSFGKHQNGTSADHPASGSASSSSAAAAARTSRTATASISAGYKPDIGQYHQKSCNMSNPVLMSKIKERICEMDLVTQMDKAKELTHFALTHQAISKEDKE